MPTAKRRAGWLKSSYSAQQNGCVEVDLTGAGARIRDTKIAASPVITFTAEQWSTWLAEVTTDHLTGTNGAVTVTTASNAWTVRSVATDATLVFDENEWIAFRRGVTDGEFDPSRSPEFASA
ncbi:MAG: DUF397 domain-containing protein [Actinomycetota bacterium]|nr:DUF397 domain-containing protein [Actinomycetota bacterium]